MPRHLSVHFLPSLLEPAELRGGIAVVIDLLRASTTIVHALAAGAKAVIPCLEVDEARRIAATHPAGTCLLGGERGGLLIEGFDLDNSPLRCTADRVTDRTIVFTTTNGTRALHACREAGTILVGALVNRRAIVERLRDDDRPVHLVCAGTRGRISADDILCAGILAASLAEEQGTSLALNDEAQVALAMAHSEAVDDDSLLNALRASTGGRDLVELGYDADIERAATRDLFDTIPEFTPTTGRIETGKQSPLPM